MRFLRGFAVVLMASMVLIGCGDDDGDVGATGTNTGSQPTSIAVTTTVAAASTPEQARAQAAALTLADLPPGYAEQAADEAPDHETTWNELVTCLGQEPAEGRTAIATSPSFKQGNTTVASTTEYKGSNEAVEALVGAFKSDAVAACTLAAYTKDFERNVPSGLTASGVEVAPLDLPGLSALGGSTSAYRASGRVGPGTPIIPVVHDFLVVFGGQAVTRLTFIAPMTAPDADFESGLVKAVADRA